MDPQNTIVCIHGNIGSGKTTTLNLLSETYNILEEPMDAWPLDWFYGDTLTRGFALQLAIQASYMNISLFGKLIERGPTFYQVFSDNVSEEEDEILSKFTEKYANCFTISIIIDTPIAECQKRIKQRGRECEQAIDIAYLSKIRRRTLQYAQQSNACKVFSGLDEPSVVAEKIKTYLVSFPKIDESCRRKTCADLQLALDWASKPGTSCFIEDILQKRPYVGK